RAHRPAIRGAAPPGRRPDLHRHPGRHRCDPPAPPVPSPGPGPYQLPRRRRHDGQPPCRPTRLTSAKAVIMALHRLTSVTIGVPNVAETAAYYEEFGLTRLADSAGLRADDPPHPPD